MAVSTAIQWFFQNEQEGIILEDDCLPDSSFFTFCQTLLAFYRHDTRVMHISGDNFQRGRIRGDGSYYFSRFPHIWGWASWRRAWNFYDLPMKTYSRFIQQDQIHNIFRTRALQKMWLTSFDSITEHQLDTWDHQWTYAIFCQNGLCILPNKNLVSNIGFGEGAHHTSERKSVVAALPTSAIGELVHPTFLIPDTLADEFSALKMFRAPLHARMRYVVKHQLRKMFTWALQQD
jgi:hypothetical protein